MRKTGEWPYLCKPIITRVQQSAVSFFWENIWSQSLGEEGCKCVVDKLLWGPYNDPCFLFMDGSTDFTCKTNIRKYKEVKHVLLSVTQLLQRKTLAALTERVLFFPLLQVNVDTQDSRIYFPAWRGHRINIPGVKDKAVRLYLIKCNIPVMLFLILFWRFASPL